MNGILGIEKRETNLQIIRGKRESNVDFFAEYVIIIIEMGE